MGTYELFLHFKQGDDLASHVASTKTASEAVRAWGADFTHRADICAQIARALEGKNVEIEAGTHTIIFVPKDDMARHVLDTLLKEKLLTAVK